MSSNPGGWNLKMIDSICDVLVPFYAKADTSLKIQEFGRPKAVSVNIFENFSQTEAFIGSPSLSKDQFDRIKNFSAAFLQQDDTLCCKDFCRPNPRLPW